MGVKWMIIISQISKSAERTEVRADNEFVREFLLNQNKYDIHFVVEAWNRLIDGKVTVNYEHFPTEERAKRDIERLLRIGLSEPNKLHGEADGGVHEDDC